ncbi:torsin-1A-like [Schistocerca nitens]|uniref:torsin-1A-like n=1 Tax=Schistocerca nitens TaxID=7011 RepID=UPI002119A966|nr:torsin-1A-like [Schistocerca nitens]
MMYGRSVFSVVFSILLFTEFTAATITEYITKIYAASRAEVCNLVDCCHASWEYANIDQLTTTLKSRVYGQHIAIDYITSALRGHIKGNNEKPLVMSFHGLPGVGKNFIANFIKKNLFKYGEEDSHIYMFSGRLHFRIEKHVELYQEQLASWVRGNVSNCAASLFIFDEVDKIPPGVLDGIKPYLDYHNNIDGVDFRNSVFIFISDTGSKAILDKMIDLYNNGSKREELSLSDFEELIRLGSFNEKGGLQKSDVVSRCVIDHYIPFLPLEVQHVKNCIKDAFHRKGAQQVSDDDIQEVLQDVTFGPEKMKLFSKSGCKRIVQKVSVVLEKKRRKYGDL